VRKDYTVTTAPTTSLTGPASGPPGSTGVIADGDERAAATHVLIDPSILYFGTPVVLISSVSSTGAVNLMPMSSAFWVGQTGVLGIGTRSQTCQNLLQSGECVLNLPSASLVTQVDRLALTTGRDPVPDGKARVGYQYVADKFAHAGLTPVKSDVVIPPRVAECPVNLEARVVDSYPLEKDDPVEAGSTIAFEVAIARVHIHPAIRLHGTANRIDPDTWRPLIMSFQQFYGLGPRVHPSRLATIVEEFYR
jgi:flavin reductase (DIM6/NTAB) family NADH-FMN oxidoreductase RutF